jgi:hypothetical protein
MSENKKFTIEELAAIKYPLEFGYGVYDRNCEIENLREAFVEGYKLAQEPEHFFNDDRVKTLEKSIEYLLKRKEKMHSNEEVIQLVSDWTDYRMSEDTKSKVTFKKWFEKFKKNKI